MEGCFMFQCVCVGGGCFSDGGGFILKWGGGTPWGSIGFGGDGGGGQGVQKNCKMGGTSIKVIFLSQML